MIKGKKGALELSVNTIIVIVIGVTLLILGLVFVRGIFKQQTDLSAKAFEEANKQLDALSGDLNEFLTIAPETVRVNAGDTSGFVLLIKNVGETSYSGVTARVTTYDNAASKGVKCEFSNGEDTQSLRSPFTTGLEDRFDVRVKTQPSSIGSVGCEISLSGGGIEQTTYSIRRDVEIIVS